MKQQFLVVKVDLEHRDPCPFKGPTGIDHLKEPSFKASYKVPIVLMTSTDLFYEYSLPQFYAVNPKL